MLAGRGHQPATATPVSPAPAPPPARAVGPGRHRRGRARKREILSVSTWLGSANPGGKSDQDQIPEAVRWAVDNGARVINISLGSTSPEWPQSWDAAFLYAEQKDVVIVAAAGNRVGGNVQVGAPATIPGVLTVAGLDRKGAASIDSSSQGISIGVAAPAENLVGGLPGGGYAEWAGTSGATPIVSGVAALIRSKWPEMSAQARSSTGSSARPRTPGAPGRTRCTASACSTPRPPSRTDVPETAGQPAGLHFGLDPGPPPRKPGHDARRGARADSSAAPTLPEPTVPVAEAPSQLDSAMPAAVVIGFGVPVRGDHRRGRASSCAGACRGDPAAWRADEGRTPGPSIRWTPAASHS